MSNTPRTDIVSTPNQPIPPEGYRLLTPEEYGTPKNGLVWNEVTGKWLCRDGRAHTKIGNIYAIPITPAVPATGDTTNEKGGEPCHPNTQKLQSSQGGSNAALNVQPGEQRQSLRDVAIVAIVEYLLSFGWTLNENFGNDEDVGQWISPITQRSHDIDYAFSLQLITELRGRK